MNAVAVFSITSSAAARSVGGISMPSAEAVLRLMANLIAVACSIGRSPGFAPLRMRSSVRDDPGNEKFSIGFAGHDEPVEPFARDRLEARLEVRADEADERPPSHAIPSSAPASSIGGVPTLGAMVVRLAAVSKLCRLSGAGPTWMASHELDRLRDPRTRSVWGGLCAYRQGPLTCTLPPFAATIRNGRDTSRAGVVSRPRPRPLSAHCGRRAEPSERGRLCSMPLDEGCPVVGHRDEARSVDRKPRTSQLLTPLTLAMG